MDERKKSYGIISDICYVYKAIWNEFRAYAIVILLWLPVRPILYVTAPFINKYVVEIISSSKGRSLNIIIFAALMAAKLMLSVIDMRFEHFRNFGARSEINNIFIKKLIKKRMAMDYPSLEDTTINDNYQKAFNTVNTIDEFVSIVRYAIEVFVAVFAYSAILVAVNPVIVLVAGIPTIVCVFINRHVYGWKNKNIDKWTNYDRQLEYISGSLSDFSYAKDVRLYNISSFMSRKFDEVWKKRLCWFNRFDVYNTKWSCVIIVILSISFFFSSFLTIDMVIKGNIGAGDFVLYFSVLTEYSVTLWGFAEYLAEFFRLRNDINYLRKYLETPDTFNHGAGEALPVEGLCIEFKNVTYYYKNASEPTIKNLSFKLGEGERLALVGLNGAGKSTVVKLMCGLYDATEGEITLNGINIKKFNREEYYSLFAAVFQDFDKLPVSISQNISLVTDEDIEHERVMEALRCAGLYDKVMSLPEKENTLMAKSVFDEATDFSGGEMQKLALARALYKDAKILLLDEPTAYLDPISEQELYLNYAEFSQEKLSLFISHRLVSTQFCDDIILLQEGQIAERGTHDELMGKGGKYAELFDIQSRYYKEKIEEDFI